MKKAVAVLLLCAVCASASACSAPAETLPRESTAVTNPENIALNLPDTILMNTENYSVTDKMVSYSLRRLYDAFCDKLGEMKLTAEDFGIVAGKPLGEQEYYIDDSAKTWLEYFAIQAEYGFMEQLVLCEAAREAGIELDDGDMATVEKELGEICKAARKAGKSENAYIAEYYGTGVNAGDIRAAFELSLLAEKYLRQAADGTDISEDAARAFAAEHGEALESVDFLVYVFPAGDEKYAEDLAEMKTAEDFLEYVHHYVTSVRGLTENDYDEILRDHVRMDNVKRGDKSASDFVLNADEGETQLTREKNGSTVIRVTRALGLNGAADENGTPAWLAEARVLMEAEAVETLTKDAADKYAVTVDRQAFYGVDIKG